MRYRVIEIVLVLLSAVLFVATFLPLSTTFFVPEEEAAPYVALKLFFLPAIGLFLLGATAAAERRRKSHHR